MEPHEYDKMAEVEDRMWWYRALHRNLQLVVERFRPRPGGRLLDAGCGTGGLLRKLGAGRSDTHLFGLDAWEPACVLTARRSGRPVVQGVLNRLPLMDGAVDCMVSADVLCHNGVDADLALRELRRCLNARGVLILNLPAYQWLLSYHDERVQQARRFTRGEVIRLLAAPVSHRSTRRIGTRSCSRSWCCAACCPLRPTRKATSIPTRNPSSCSSVRCSAANRRCCASAYGCLSAVRCCVVARKRDD